MFLFHQNGKCLIKLGAEESLVIKCDHNGKILKMHGSEHIKNRSSYGYTYKD